MFTSEQKMLMAKPFRVKQNSALFNFLDEKNVLISNGITSLGVVFYTIRDHIRKKLFFDFNNPPIIIGDLQLENILGMRALHCSQVDTVSRYAQNVLNTTTNWISTNQNEMRKRKSSFDIPSQSDRLYRPCSPTLSPPLSPHMCSTV